MSVLLEGRYAVLGYGSLIWDLDDLAPHVELPWAMGGGPLLPMEFSRISPKRKMGLVVVLDPDNGVPCPTHAIASVKTDIHSVADDLMRRERAKSIEQIGAVCMNTGFVRTKMPSVGEAVKVWCETVGARGAVWTDLPQNFESETGQGFSLDTAIAYLRTLEGESLLEAKRYIDYAPEATATPLRHKLNNDSWWQSLPYQ